MDDAEREIQEAIRLGAEALQSAPVFERADVVLQFVEVVEAGKVLEYVRSDVFDVLVAALVEPGDAGIQERAARAIRRVQDERDKLGGGAGSSGGVVAL